MNTERDSFPGFPNDGISPKSHERVEPEGGDKDVTYVGSRVTCLVLRRGLCRDLVQDSYGGGFRESLCSEEK